MSFLHFKYDKMKKITAKLSENTIWQNSCKVHDVYLVKQLIFSH